MSTLAVDSIENLAGDERFGPQLESATAIAGATSYSFTIPTYAKRIYVHFSSVSTNGASGIRVQVGNSGGILTTGYESSSVRVDHSGGTSGGNSTSGFYIATTAAVDVLRGIITLSDMGNGWACTHALHCEQVGVAFRNITGGGTNYGFGPTTGTLTQIRINTANGVDTLDNGTVVVSYE